jgi:prevent-host-death family protein
MEVTVSGLRAHLREWLERARDGGDVVITRRGVPVARLLGISGTATTLERLTAEGVIGTAAAPRPRASGRVRPRPRRPLSSILSDQRR